MGGVALVADGCVGVLCARVARSDSVCGCGVHVHVCVCDHE